MAVYCLLLLIQVNILIFLSMWNDLAKLYVACLVCCGSVHVQQTSCLNSTLTNLLPGAPPP